MRMNRLHLAHSAIVPACWPRHAAAAAPPFRSSKAGERLRPCAFAGAAKSQLDEFLLDEEKKTSNQIVVLTVPSLDGDDDRRLRRSTCSKPGKLGQKGKDNGVLVVAAIKDRKMRIEVGYGLEGVLTDALSSQIIRNEIAPQFKAGDYGGGLLAGVTAIDKAIRGEYKADPRKPPPTSQRVARSCYGDRVSRHLSCA